MDLSCFSSTQSSSDFSSHTYSGQRAEHELAHRATVRTHLRLQIIR
jgi:hypothetical protein